MPKKNKNSSKSKKKSGSSSSNNNNNSNSNSSCKNNNNNNKNSSSHHGSGGGSGPAKRLNLDSPIFQSLNFNDPLLPGNHRSSASSLFSHYHNNSSSSNSYNHPSSDVGTYYQEYKETTQSCLQGLKTLVPKGGGSGSGSNASSSSNSGSGSGSSSSNSNISFQTVNDIIRASDLVYENCLDMNSEFYACFLEEAKKAELEKKNHNNNNQNNDKKGDQTKESSSSSSQKELELKFHSILSRTIFIPPKLISLLETSIQLRKDIMGKYLFQQATTNKSKGKGGGNKGKGTSSPSSSSSSDSDAHTHIISVLEYCLNTLKSCVKLTKDMKGLTAWLLIYKQMDTTEEGKETTDNGNHTQPSPLEQQETNPSSPSPSHSPSFNFNTIPTQESCKKYVDLLKQERQQNLKDTKPPVISDITSKYTVEDDLIRGSDRLQACSLLYTMETLMGVVASNYRELKVKTSKSRTYSTNPSSSHHQHHNQSCDLQYLMYCAMVTNKCIQSVERAEAQLALDCPYLSSIYAVLGLVFLPDCITKFEEAIEENIEQYKRHLMDLQKQKQQSSSNNGGGGGGNNGGGGGGRNKKKKKKKVILSVDRGIIVKGVGDIIEISSRPDFEIRYQQITAQLTKETGLPAQKVKDLTWEIKQKFQSSYEASLSYQWLDDHTYIGGDRPFLYTLLYLQAMFIRNAQSKSKPTCSDITCFGTYRWDEDLNPAHCFMGDMDEIYIGSILPELTEWCESRGECPSLKVVPPGFVLDKISGFTSQTLPIIHMLRKFIREGKTGSIGDSDGHHGSYSRPVPCTLVFGMHAILTSIMEMQGSSDISSYATATEHAWKKLFRNLEKRVVEDEYNDLGRFVILACLPYPVGEESVRGGGRMAFLNPLMAGSYLLFANYVVAIGLGCNTIDFLGQLRLVLHLYNAFLQTNLIESDNNNDNQEEQENANDKKSTSTSSSSRPRLIMLEETMKVFSNTKAIWAFSNKLPSHGEFMKTSLLAWGYSPTSASQIIKYINSKYGEKGMPPDSHSGGGNRNSRNNRRKLKGIVQEEISNSYSFVMNEDFMYRTEADNRKKLHHDESNNNNNNNEGEGNSSSITQQNNTYDVLETIMHISSTKSSMYNDLHNGILWTNWTEVGCICNDFIRALMKEFLSEFHPDDELTQNMVKYFSKFDAYAEYELYSKIICSKVLHPIDEDPQCEIGKKCAKFMQDFFEKVEKSEYYFYDANNKNHSSKNQNSNSYYDNEDLMSVKFHQRQQQQYTTNNDDEDVYEDDEDMMNSDGGSNLVPKKQRSLDDKHKQQQLKANNGGSSTQDNSNTSSNNHTNNDNDANDKEEESIITYHELRERALKILNDPKNKKKSLALQPPPPPLTAIPMTGANSTSTSSSSSSYGHHVHEKTLSRKLSHEQHMMENDERITNTNYTTVGVQQEEPQPPPPFTAIHPQSTYEQLKDLNYEQMKQLAIEKGLDVSDCETKRDVVHLILTQKMEKTKPTRYRKLRDKTLKILERKDLKVKKTQEEEEEKEKEKEEKETVLKDEEKVVKQQSNVQDNNVQASSKPKANNTNKANIHKAKEDQQQQMKEFDMIVDMSNVQSMKDAIAVMSNPTMLSSRQQHDRIPSPPPGLDQSDDDTTSSSHSSTRSYYENNINNHNNRKKKGTSNSTISTGNTFETGEELRKSFSEKLKIHQSSSSSTAALKKVSSSPPSSSTSTFLKHSHHRDLVSRPRSNSFFIHEILTKMSVSELKNLAKEQGLDITKCVEKKEIVNMIVSPEEFFSNYREYRMEALEKLKKEKGISGQQQHSQTQKQTMKQEYGSTIEEVFIESITTYEDLLEMRVSELKKLAKDYGTDISKCVEKKDIAQLLANELSSSNNNVDNNDNQEGDEIIINSFEEEHHHYHQSHTYQELKEMSVSKLKKLAKELDIDTRSCSTKKEIITEVNSGLGNGDPYIRGTTIFKSAPLGPNPLDPSLQYRTERGDGTRENPFQGYLVIDVVNNKDGEQEPAFRFVKPGKLTKEKQILTFRMVDSGERKLCHLSPLSDSPPPKNKNYNKKKEKYYRHIGSFTLRELRQIGWDGAMYQSDYVGTWVPYVDGYDSEEDFEFEDFDQRQQRRNGIIGLPQTDVGKFMLLPDLDGDQSLVQLSRI